MMEVLSHLTALEDVILLAGVPAVSYLLKAAFKPNKLEMKIIAQVLLTLMMVMVKKLQQYHSSHAHLNPHLESMESDITDLKDKIKRSKVVLG